MADAPPTTLVDQYGRPLTIGSLSGGRGRGRLLDAADTSGFNGAPLLTRLDDINRLVPAMDRRIVVGASESIVSNYDTVEGMLWAKAILSVGRAWEPVFLGADKAWGDEATHWLLNEWYKVGDLEGADDSRFNLELDSVTIDRTGDVLILLSSFDGGYPATQRIPTWRIGLPYAGDQMVSSVVATRNPDGTPASSKNQPVPIRLPVPLRLRDGFIYDQRGRKLYCRLRVDDGLSLFPSNDFVDVHRRDYIYVFDKSWYSQGRGWPSLTASVRKLADALQSHKWEQLAMLIASSIGLIEYNETGTQQTDPNDPLRLGDVPGAPGETPPNQQLAAEVLFGGLVRYFKAGSGAKLQQFINERPGPIWEAFTDRIEAAAARGMNWSPMLMSGKASPGGQLARSDIEQVNASIHDRQDLLAGARAREDGYAVSKAINLEILPPYKGSDRGGFLKWGYTFPGEFSIDDGRDSQNRREDYKIGFKNDDRILAEIGGGGPSQHWTKRAAFVAMRKRAAVLENRKPENVELGVVVDDRDMQMMSPNEQPDGVTGAGETKGGGTEDGTSKSKSKTSANED